jgi:signal transduction histidine kinase
MPRNTPASILIVEDERLVARDIADILAQHGYVVPTICTTAECALTEIQRHQPDLVLMDIRLAGAMDGVEAAQIIQAQFQRPVVYLTANADPVTLDRVQSSRPFGYLLKPFDERTLTTTIDIALARYEAERQIQTALDHRQSITEDAQAQAQSVLDDKLQYFAMAAHELRNPLGVIQSVAELLTMPNLNLSEERRDRYLQRMQAATANLDELLQSILTYSYSSAGHLDSQPKPFDLVEFCQEQITGLQASIGRHHQCRFHAQAAHCPVWLDEQLLWHLLTNLLANAIKYSPGPSAPIGQVELRLTWDEQQVWLTVGDNGIGIPAGAGDRLFEPFYRADNTGDIPGTGLGLALAHQCSERQGGQIRCQPEPHPLGGAAFAVELPRDCRSAL